MTRIGLVMWMACAQASGPSQGAEAQLAEPVEELGTVRWTRGIDAAIARSAKSGHPTLVLFDEVPGCSTVKGFGRSALTHPLLVEAAETLFEPVVVYNNTADDASVCAQYEEPRWNNPVLRVLDTEGATVSRFDGPYSEAGFARFLSSALAADAPPWLSDLAVELEAEDRAQTATYSMACFWTGEAHLAGAEGVLAAKTGWQGGREVVEVSFDPEQTSARALGAHAAGAGFREASKGTLRATPGDDRHALRRTPYASVPMTPRQATRANHLIANGVDPAELFSARQLSLRGGSESNLGHGDLRAAFASR